MWPFKKHECQFRIIGLHTARWRVIRRSEGQAIAQSARMFWFYKCDCGKFRIAWEATTTISGKLPEKIHSLSDYAVKRYLKRYLRKEDRI